ncbi:hypothetical protein BDZ45DRAFT_687114 [Acephala macrosclerotiorum]|nr:hypothetical protein BDZ45DRAFT_687114 [Acephala macrosclerotiorum]
MASQPSSCDYPYAAAPAPQRGAPIPVFDGNADLHSNYEYCKVEYDNITSEKCKKNAQPSEAVTFELRDNLHTQSRRAPTWVFRWDNKEDGFKNVLPLPPSPAAPKPDKRSPEEKYDLEREHKAYGLWYREEAKHVTDLGEYRPKPLVSVNYYITKLQN